MLRQTGSPPRMRGKAEAGMLLFDETGITPAHAGKSFINNDIGHKHQDHPRACGEKEV